MGDPERYRTSDEVKCWQDEEDPIGIYYKYLVAQKIASAAELDELGHAAEQEILEAVQYAESSPEPQAEDLFKYIFVDAE